jgi:NADPH:quinone reductase-like Zn-dependent oxidoreductase
MMQRSTFSAMRGFASFAVKNMKLEKAAPLAAVGASQVSLSMIASPVHKADRAVASSGAIGGSEGVGKVTAVGAGVTNLKVGDWVVPKLGAGAWRSEAVVEAAHVMMVRAGAWSA